jgi:hypothetical protein
MGQSCNVAEIYRRFGGKHCLCHQSRSIICLLGLLSFPSWWWRQYFHRKRRQICTALHDVTLQKEVCFPSTLNSLQEAEFFLRTWLSLSSLRSSSHPKVYYYVHKSPPLNHIPSYCSPFCAITSHLLHSHLCSQNCGFSYSHACYLSV